MKTHGILSLHCRGFVWRSVASSPGLFEKGLGTRLDDPIQTSASTHNSTRVPSEAKSTVHSSNVRTCRLLESTNQRAVGSYIAIDRPEYSRILS